MPTLQAYQHIYANVEKDQSPDGRGGFQTLFYTSPGLTRPEIDELEERLVLVGGDDPAPKDLFFATDTGKVVVSHIVPLPETDDAGRGGRYLAHSFAFRKKAFTDAAVTPLAVLKAAPFIEDLLTALSAGNRATKRLPEIEIQVEEDVEAEVEAAGEWPSGAFARLSRLALHAERLSLDRRAVALVGTRDQIVDALRVALAPVPAPLRLHCSFDTGFRDGSISRTYFWGAGLSEPPSDPRMINVDLAAREVEGYDSEEAPSPYEKWVEERLKQERRGEVVRHRDEAYAAAQMLSGEKYDSTLVRTAPVETVAQVLATNPALLRERVRERAAERVPETLANRATKQLLKMHDHAELAERLQRGFHRRGVLDALYEAYKATDFRTPPRLELGALDRFVSKHDPTGMRAATAYWTGRFGMCLQLAETLDETGYRKLCVAALRDGYVDPLQFLRPGHVSRFLDAYLDAPEERQPAAADVVARILALDESDLLSRMTPLLQEISPRAVAKVARVIDGRQDVPEGFRRTVEEIVAATPTSVFGRLRRLLGKRS